MQCHSVAIAQDRTGQNSVAWNTTALYGTELWVSSLVLSPVVLSSSTSETHHPRCWLTAPAVHGCCTCSIMKLSSISPHHVLHCIHNVVSLCFLVRVLRMFTFIVSSSSLLLFLQRFWRLNYERPHCACGGQRRAARHRLTARMHQI